MPHLPLYSLCFCSLHFGWYGTLGSAHSPHGTWSTDVWGLLRAFSSGWYMAIPPLAWPAHIRGPFGLGLAVFCNGYIVCVGAGTDACSCALLLESFVGRHSQLRTSLRGMDCQQQGYGGFGRPGVRLDQTVRNRDGPEAALHLGSAGQRGQLRKREPVLRGFCPARLALQLPCPVLLLLLPVLLWGGWTATAGLAGFGHHDDGMDCG